MDYLIKNDGTVVITTKNWEERSKLTIQEYCQQNGFTLVSVDNLFERFGPRAEDFDGSQFNRVKYETRRKKFLAENKRRERMSECFPIINRSQLWYNTLTDAQKGELGIWYQQWLDLPNEQENTLTELPNPTKPSWLE